MGGARLQVSGLPRSFLQGSGLLGRCATLRWRVEGFGQEVTLHHHPHCLCQCHHHRHHHHCRPRHHPCISLSQEDQVERPRVLLLPRRSHLWMGDLIKTHLTWQCSRPRSRPSSAERHDALHLSSGVRRCQVPRFHLHHFYFNLRVRCRHSSSLERLWLPGGVLHRWTFPPDNHDEHYNHHAEQEEDIGGCPESVWENPDDCTCPASTRGYPGGERQRLEVDITIIGPRQGRRPRQKSIESIRSKVQNK